MWLSLGPLPQIARTAAAGARACTACFYDHVPGFDGLRVPARYAMVAAVYLAIAGRLSARRGCSQRSARPVARSSPLAWPSRFSSKPRSCRCRSTRRGVTARSRRRRASSPRRARRPSIAQLATMPGDARWSPSSRSAIRPGSCATSTTPRSTGSGCVNGYSGGFPHGYKVRVARLQRVDGDAGRGVARAASTPERRTSIVHEARAAAGRGASDRSRGWTSPRRRDSGALRRD